MMRNTQFSKKLSGWRNIKSFSITGVYQPKTKEDIVNRVHKHNVNTVTMVNKL